ncbi:type I restriction and modification enzyme subunit R-like protein [Arcticibacter tournemirensis]|nr:hypothetical protein [Arcticibacter tournemirensis]TQM51767.1 type I restriction and modification enzyme subunit R-like protein [Arcticibacter tournemirensis]
MPISAGTISASASRISRTSKVNTSTCTTAPELIHRDQINVVYILKLLTRLKTANPSDAEKQRKIIIDLLGSEVTLRSKRELIEKFIQENLPLRGDSGDADPVPGILTP